VSIMQKLYVMDREQVYQRGDVETEHMYIIGTSSVLCVYYASCTVRVLCVLRARAFCVALA
jgi:hypothetical protein